MPKGWKPEAARKEDERAAQIAHIDKTIRAACITSPYKNLTGLGAAIGVNGRTLRTRLRTGSLRTVDLIDIINAIEMDEDAIMDLLGRGKKKDRRTA